MQKNSSINYSKLSVSMNSKGRLFKEKNSIYRNPYQRDRDRIIHSTAFRRLKHKTQVFVNTSKDHYRTRITHSLEVSQIARTLGKYFNLNEDLCETLSLSHDLGHTPFGHAGEEILDECMHQHGGFDHNIQTLRIVTKLENKYYNFRGLNLCIETLDGLIKHNGPLYSTDKIDLIIGKNYFKKKIKFNKQPTLEAQIASISDDIAYNSHDLEDGLKANLFTINDLKYIPILSDIIKIHEKRINKLNQDLFIRQIVREIIDVMVKDIINSIKKNIRINNIKTINDIYNLNKAIVTFSSEMNLFNVLIKRFLKKNMYLNKDIQKKTNQGKKIIKKLFLYVNKNPKKFFLTKNLNKKSKNRIVCDFIAGMTDRYAIELYKKIK